MSRWSLSPRALNWFFETTRLAAATTSFESSGACTMTFCRTAVSSRWAFMLSRAATSCAAMFCPRLYNIDALISVQLWLSIVWH